MAEDQTHRVQTGAQASVRANGSKMGAQRTKWRDIKDSDSHINSPPADSIGHLSTEQQK